jgi:hypothetical protein
MSLSILDSKDPLVNEKARRMAKLANSMSPEQSLEYYRKVIAIKTPGKKGGYSPLNSFWITMDGGDCVAGYQAWAKYNRIPKQGCHGILIATPKWRKRTKKDGREELYLSGFGHCYVFDVSVTEILDPSKPDGFELWKAKYKNIEKRTGSADFNLAEAILKLQKAHIEVSQRLLQPALGGYAQKGRIVLNSLFSDEEQYSTLLHEIAHICAGHCEPNCTLDTATKECQVELVTALILEKAGVDSKFSIQYIANWSQRSNVVVDPLQLAAIMTKVEKILN